jgi:hypothetical protein
MQLTGFFSHNRMAYLPPILARRDGAKSLFLENGRRIPVPKAAGWSRC